jgi:hypothetical protein
MTETMFDDIHELCTLLAHEQVIAVSTISFGWRRNTGRGGLWAAQ